ncbi:MAG: ABC transporter permease [Eubacterium sp.]|nr:ABC transporter permease [Eubacterium sp.]
MWKRSLLELMQVFNKYRFLLAQLVGKEFKNKYRRSYLGILWSLLNPLLMMMIVSSVFSFIFRFDIENFQVYLILGQISFNFFSEATQISVTTIVGAGQLIKKVYVPKYIFPLSKVLFSFLNFGFSFLAAIAVMICYGVTPGLSILYLPLWLAYYFVFTLGISLLLSACMVFLRDTQHLYSLVMVAFGYLTPVFYPVTSLAPWMQEIMKFNPLYQYMTYLRNILLYGYSPDLWDNVVCLAYALVSAAVGMHYFFRKQDQFILYI